MLKSSFLPSFDVIGTLDVLDDVALGQCLGKYQRLLRKTRLLARGRAHDPDYPDETEIEQLERALAEIEAEIAHRGRLLLFLNEGDEAALRKHPIVSDWIARGWQSQTVQPSGNGVQRQVLVRLVASDAPTASGATDAPHVEA